MEAERLSDLARRASRTGQVVFTPFLDPAESEEAEAAARRERIRCAFCGGYPDAERRVCAFYEYEEPEEYPISCLEITWNAKFDRPPAHRDLLGALMGLGFERDRTGDIVLGADRAWLFSLPEMAGYIRDNLTEAGHAHLRLSLADPASLDIAPDGQAIRETVPSLRLDAVVAAGYDLSRAQASEIIRAGRVRVDFRLCEKPDRELTEGSLISVRGLGRLRLVSLEGATRRGRMAVRLIRYA